MKFKITICAVCTALLVLLSGCGKSDEECVQEYLQKRYGEEFVVLNTERHADGYTPFSYTLIANCTPEAHSGYLFRTKIIAVGTDEEEYFDTYGQGIMNYRAADMMKEKLDYYFGDCFVWVDLNNYSDIQKSDMESITFQSYFSSIEPDYIENPDKLNNVSYWIAIDNDAYQKKSYEDEYDFLFNTLKEVSENLQVNGQLNIYYFANKDYKAYSDWYSEHTNAMANMKNEYKSYCLAYDVAEHELTVASLRKEPMTKEMYVTQRTNN